jgi:hypothetical protein
MTQDEQRHSGKLLSVLHVCCGDRGFDATSIMFDVADQDRAAPSSYDLIDALQFLGVRQKRSGPGYLTESSRSRIRKWFDRVEGVQIDGLVLERDRFGWCFVRLV